MQPEQEAVAIRTVPLQASEDPTFARHNCGEHTWDSSQAAHLALRGGFADSDGWGDDFPHDGYFPSSKETTLRPSAVANPSEMSSGELTQLFSSWWKPMDDVTTAEELSRACVPPRCPPLTDATLPVEEFFSAATGQREAR